jgi:uncharacterized protein YacL
MSQITPQGQEQENVTEFRFVRYGVAILSAIFVGVVFFVARSSTSYAALNIPLWKEVICIIISFILGYAGFIIGDLLRQWVMPSHFIANDFATLVRMKIFWKIGPQFGGMFLGCIIPWLLFGKFMSM